MDFTARSITECVGHACRLTLGRLILPLETDRFGLFDKFFLWVLFVWDDGSSGSHMHTERDPPNGKNVPLTMFGRIPQEQDVPAGTYTDTLTVTVNY